MSNLQRFNETLEDFNQEVGQLKEVSGAYKKIHQLTETYSAISKQFDENSKTLHKINELQKSQQAKVANSLIELERSNKQNKIELAKLFEEKTDQIRKDNKDFYKDLEGTIKIKLDENKSQIKHLIENERNQIKQIFEFELAKSTRELNQVFKIEIDVQTKLLTDNQKTIKITLWIIGVLGLLMSALIAFKLW